MSYYDKYSDLSHQELTKERKKLYIRWRDLPITALRKPKKGELPNEERIVMFDLMKKMAIIDDLLKGNK